MHNSISPASTGRLKSVCALLIVTMGLLIAGSASATSVSYTLDAHFIFPSSLDITGQGTFTADDVTGVISAFEWAAIPSYSFSSLSLTDFDSGSATFVAGVLTGLSVDANDGYTRLVLSVGDGDGGPIAELRTDLFFAMGSYAIFDAETGTQILGVTASPMPEPSAAVLYGAGLLIANGTMRRRRQR